MQPTRWSIQELARLTGTTSRTLRHYDAIGLLAPADIGANGYRYYGEAELRALQRILLLRELGVGLEEIRRILKDERDERDALRVHRQLLERERERITQQLSALDHTIAVLEGKESLVAETMFEGFDYRQYRDEVAERWGEVTARASSEWWEGMNQTQQRDWQHRLETLNRDWITAWEAGESSTSPVGQHLAERHLAWLISVPGTPAQDPDARDSYVRGLADMYVADERFAANYGGVEGAKFVRDALIAYLDAS